MYSLCVGNFFVQCIKVVNRHKYCFIINASTSICIFLYTES